MRSRTALIALLAAFTVTPASAAPYIFLGKFGSWAAYSSQTKPYRKGDRTDPTCYVISWPIQTAAAAAKRARPSFMISDQPARNVREEPQVITGYERHDSDRVRVSVGGRSFDFFLKGGDGWIVRLSETAPLIAAMRSGSTMVVTGSGPGGAAIRDSYDLSGIGKALAKAHTACGGLIVSAPVSRNRG